MPVTQHIPLVLASGSAVRAQMLKQVGLNFSVVPSGVDEEAIKQRFLSAGNGEPVALAGALARAKSGGVAADYPNHLTLGADQLCVGEDGVIFDKPGSPERACEQLRHLRGCTHAQHSAVCLMRGEQVLWETVATAQLTIRKLSDSEIAAYVAADQPLQSCGAYRLEGLGRHLFSEIAGDHDVIKGLPLVPLLFTLYQQRAITLD